MTTERVRVRLPVQGMHCTGCAHSIEMGLEHDEGISRISVHYPTAQAEIEYDPRILSLHQIVDLIDRQGFSVPQAESRLAVNGMTCTGCADSVARVLSDVDGVITAEVSFAREEALLSYLPEQVDLPFLQEKVARAG